MVEVDRGKRVLIVGGGKYSGGRESALAHKYSQSPQVEAIFLWPGNDLAWINCDVPVHSFSGESVTDSKKIIQAAKDLRIDLVDVSSDEPLAKGVVDDLQKRKIITFGAASGSAQLEFDKHFSRRIQSQMGMPIPEYHFERKTTRDSLHRALNSWYQEQSYSPDSPSVIKANGLADGKGVYVADSLEEAHFGLDYVLSLPKGWQSGILFEQKVGGPHAKEWSDFFLVGLGPDTRSAQSAYRRIQWFSHLGYFQDHKRLGEGDTGLNTGGMGAVAYPLFVQMMVERLNHQVYPKLFGGLRRFNSPMIVYLSLMYNPDDESIYLIEINTRHGDPEAQVLLPGLENDYYDLIYAAAIGARSPYTTMKINHRFRIATAVVPQGYPDNSIPNQNQPINGLSEVIADGKVVVYGAKATQKGARYLTGPGRDLYLVAEGEDIYASRQTLNQELARLSGPIYYRRDIGYKEELYIDENYDKLLDLGAIALTQEKV